MMQNAKRSEAVKAKSAFRPKKSGFMDSRSEFSEINREVQTDRLSRLFSDNFMDVPSSSPSAFRSESGRNPSFQPGILNSGSFKHPDNSSPNNVIQLGRTKKKKEKPKKKPKIPVHHDSDSKKRSRKYLPGMHGNRKSEQKRLTKAYPISVSGSTHESEHTIGFEPINQTTGLKRGTQGRAKELENQAPAYQEVKELHRDHIGTGTTKTHDESGFNSEEYRRYQRTLMEDGDISSAVQLNQLGYAFDPKSKEIHGTLKGKAASDSYRQMIENMNSVTYARKDADVTVNVDAWQRAEMYLARNAAMTRKWPSKEEIADALKKFGLDAADAEMTDEKDSDDQTGMAVDDL